MIWFLHRSHEFEVEYTKSRPQRLLSQLSSYTADDHTLPSWLSQCYDDIIQFLESEADNIQVLFNNNEKAIYMIYSLLSFTLSTFSQQLNEKLKELRSPQLILDSFAVTDEFGQKVFNFFSSFALELQNVTMVNSVSGSSINSSNNSKDSIGNLLSSVSKLLVDLLTCIYNSYLNFLDQYTEQESVFLQHQLSCIITKLTFDNSVMNQSSKTQKNTNDDGDDENDDGFLFLSDGHDPIELFVSYSERLVSAADESLTPISECLRRSLQFMGGLKSKSVFRLISTSLITFIKQLITKIDDLRFVCGVPPSTDITSSQSEVSTDENRIGFDNWIKKFESFDVGSKELLQCALRSLQATGRLMKRIHELESIIINLFTNLYNTLYRDGLTADKAIDKCINLALANHTSIATQYVVYILQQDVSLSSELRSFLSTSTSLHASHTLLSNVFIPISKCKVSSALLLFDLATSIPDKVLADLFADEVWTSNLETHHDNILPQSAFTQVITA